MQRSTLFPLDREPLKPAKNRHEPVIWLHRMVILSAFDASAVIRNIPFRRGLNIIKTGEMATDSKITSFVANHREGVI